jgi:predicted transcriptional regulator
MRTNDAATLFAAEVARAGSQTKAAAELGISRATVIDYIRRRKRPSDKVRSKIAIWSGGRIPAESWFTREERQELARFRRSVAAGAR